MPRFRVEIKYKPVPMWAKETAHLFDPPADSGNPADEIRVFITMIYGRNEKDAIRKAIISRREVSPEKLK